MSTASIKRIKKKLPERLAEVRGDRSQRQFARDLGVGRLLLTHFRAHMDTEAGHASALARLGETFGPHAGIVEDLDVYTV